MNKLAIPAVVGLGLAGTGAWWWLREEPAPPPAAAQEPAPAAAQEPAPVEHVIGLEQPLPLDEQVEVRWVDDATGEEDVWQVTKREIAPEELSAAADLPEPDPDAEDHVPDESARTLTAMGVESWKRGEIRQAMAQLEKAIETDPDDPQPRTQLGRLQVLAMNYRVARTHLKRAAELQPKDPQVWLDLATVDVKLRDVQASTAEKKRAQELLMAAPRGVTTHYAEGGTEVRVISVDPVTGFFVAPGTQILP